MPYSVIRSHEICAGHRVVGHESKCRHLHGHNYVFHFKVQAASGHSQTESGFRAGMQGRTSVEKLEKLVEEKRKLGHFALDKVGRVIDFSVVKSTLCQWLEDNWDHKFLAYEEDHLIRSLYYAAPRDIGAQFSDMQTFQASIVFLPFNPTAENLAAHMVNVIGPMLLAEHGVELVSCTIEETSKCHVEYTK